MTHLRIVRCGDLGEGQEEREYEPLTAPPMPKPHRTPVPTEPEKVPA